LPQRTDIFPLLARAYGLTSREREVTALVSEGMTNPEVAKSLSIAQYTVTDHLKAIYAKTGATNRNDLVAMLSGQARTGLVERCTRS
jgi:DNA-binding CsgD family transcriptional regulator